MSPERAKVWRDQFTVTHASTFLVCPACGAAVPPITAQKHADWHNGGASNGSEVQE